VFFIPMKREKMYLLLKAVAVLCVKDYTRMETAFYSHGKRFKTSPIS